MIISDIEQGTEEWLQLRKDYITATDASIIARMNPYCDPKTLWKRKMGIIPEQETNAAMEKGKELEPIARAKFEELFGVKVYPKVVFNSHNNFQMASLDGLCKNASYAVEIKCGKKAFENMKKIGRPEDNYWTQIQHQLSILDLPKMHYFVFWDGEYETCEVHRDDGFIKHLIEDELKFYNSMKNFKFEG